MTSVGPEGHTALYRFFDVSEVLLYAGITHNPSIRFGDHLQKKQWWQDVQRVEIEWFDTRAKAEKAEAVAILAESPKWNIAIPDGDGRYRTGTGRPQWVPSDEQTRLLADLRDARSRYEAAEADLWAKFDAGRAGRIPVTCLTEVSGLARATVYRRKNRRSSLGET